MLRHPSGTADPRKLARRALVDLGQDALVTTTALVGIAACTVAVFAGVVSDGAWLWLRLALVAVGLVGWALLARQVLHGLTDARDSLETLAYCRSQIPKRRKNR